ncbi:MAG TPA: aldo/keto reductase, partial [Gammaproteobacteria bacterium]|nr:aldo/keto reductase [Gammaproteobacteria bacterium]
MGMTRRPLGQTDLLLSPIGLGTVKIGRNTDVKYPEGFELPSDQVVVDLLKLAASLGINCLDTAPA